MKRKILGFLLLSSTLLTTSYVEAIQYGTVSGIAYPTVNITNFGDSSFVPGKTNNGYFYAEQDYIAKLVYDTKHYNIIGAENNDIFLQSSGNNFNKGFVFSYNGENAYNAKGDQKTVLKKGHIYRITGAGTKDDKMQIVDVSGIGGVGSGVTYSAGSDISISSANAISVNKTGAVASGNTGIITGGAVYNAIQDVKNNIKTYKAGSDISIASDNAISVSKNGQIANGNTGIVTGDTVYKVTNALESRLATQQTKVASNTTTLNDLSTTVSGLSGSIADINSNVMSATKNLASSLSNRMQSDMGNLTADGKAVIRDLIKETLKSYNSNASTSAVRDNISSPVATYAAPIVHSDTPADTVTSKDLDTIKTDFDTKLDAKVNKTDFNALKDTVGANTDKIAKNTESINANTAAIADLKTGKADVDGGNIDVTKFTEKLGVGEITKDNGGLVTGGTVFTALEQKADYGYVNAGFNMMQGQMQSMQQRLTQDINRVGAGAAALAGLHPQDYDPNNKLDFAAGYGHYKNANATALGIFYRPNAGTTISLAGTIGNGDPMISAGLSFKLGMGKNVEKVVITKEKYDEQQAENQEMKERIHELEVALQSMMNK